MPKSTHPTATKKRTTGWRNYLFEIAICVAGFVAMNAILLARAYWETDHINPGTAGELGDFVGGYVGTGFVLLSVVLLYRTLRTQRENAQRQSFEARYFELIKLHRENVAEMKLQDSEGRRVFLPMLRELWVARRIVQNCVKEHSVELSQKKIVHLAYYCIFYGAGPGSSRMLKASLKEFDSGLIEDVENWLRDPETRAQIREEMALDYEPFEGHQSRLGHYYRHLYQSVAYVHNQQIDLDKYDYVKTIRAQLSTHEQAFLLVNSLTPLGAKWWEDGFMLRYRMVKNIPRNFLNPEVHLDVGQLFSPGYFEWEEHKGAA